MLITGRVEEQCHHRQTATIGKASPPFLVFSRAIAPTLRLRMSSLPKGTPCYALVWEGEIGAFYEIDSALNITLLADVWVKASQLCLILNTNPLHYVPIRWEIVMPYSTV
jgi:hypothetical protein